MMHQYLALRKFPIFPVYLEAWVAATCGQILQYKWLTNDNNIQKKVIL